MLDRWGFGPQTTPARTVKAWRSAQLLAYQEPNSRQPAILVVPAPIKTAYIWDLAPGSSAVERCLSAGLQVYLVQWKSPRRGDERLGLAQYADRTLGDCLDAISAETGARKTTLAGHSLGGTFAAIFTSIHPERIQALVELEGPAAFGHGRLESAVTGMPPGEARWLPSGNIPGSFLDWTSACADPLTFAAEPWEDWLKSGRSAHDFRLHLQVRRWSLDERPMARHLFEEIEDGLYRQNRFAEGRLHIGDRLANPKNIQAPVLGVMDPRSRIVPPASLEAYRSKTGSADVQFAIYPGDTGVMMQHVGVLIGRTAHEVLWPRILKWIRARRASRATKSGMA